MANEAPLMSTAKLNLFSRAIIVTLFTVNLILLAGRDHFMLGTILITLRWGFVTLALIMLYVTSKRTASRYFKVMLMIVIVFMSLEYGWNKVTEKSLNKDRVSTELAIMTYNVFFRNTQPTSAIEKIRSCNPDILVIQELTPGWQSALEKSLGENFPYSRTIPLRGTHGIGVYSKFPVTNHKLLGNDPAHPFAQVLEFEVNKKKVQIINAHLASPAIAVEYPQHFFQYFSKNYALRSRQLKEIEALTNEHNFHAQILVGDLNTTPYEPLYRNLKRNWVNLYEEAGVGNGGTFPNTHKIWPLLKLDYIFGRGNIDGIEVRTIDGGSSDHLALLGKIRI